MEFTTTSNTSNLCIFCYKSFSPEYHHGHQNTAKVHTFCVNLTRMLNGRRANTEQRNSTLSSKSFSCCKGCEIIVTQACDIYHEMKRFELIFLWKLDTLGKIMKLADKVPSRVAFVKDCFKSDDDENCSNRGKCSSTQIEDFELLRSKIRNQCNDARKLSKHQPRVMLRRFDQPTKLPKRQVLLHQEALKIQSNFNLALEWTISHFAVIYLLSLTSGPEKMSEDLSHTKFLLSLDIHTDDGSDQLTLDIGTLTSSVENIADHISLEQISQKESDEFILNTETVHKTSPASTGNAKKDHLSERLSVNHNIEEFTIPNAVTEQFIDDRTQLDISTDQLEYNIKTEKSEDENRSEDGNDFDDNNSSVSNNKQEQLEFDNAADTVQKAEGIHYNLDKHKNDGIKNMKTEQFSSSGSSSETSDTDEDYDRNSKSNYNLTHDNKTSKLFTCPQCGSSFKRNSCLKRHEEYHKKREDWKYECSYCKKKWTDKQSLRSHLLTHSEYQKRLESWKCQCSFCGMKLPSNSKLKDHLRIHSVEKPFICEECGKGFKMKRNLIRHRETHQKSENPKYNVESKKSREEWKYQCSTCGWKCATKKDLMDHLTVHSVERPFTCEQCGKDFKRKRNLARHSKQLHDDPSKNELVNHEAESEQIRQGNNK